MYLAAPRIYKRRDDRHGTLAHGCKHDHHHHDHRHHNNHHHQDLHDKSTSRTVIINHYHLHGGRPSIVSVSPLSRKTEKDQMNLQRRRDLNLQRSSSKPDERFGALRFVAT
eukprot:6202497-Pleurochrysis_carterae.AAC.2